VSKVLVVIEENHSLAQMQHGMPFLYAQARRFGYATHYRAITHPSLPNYLAITYGSTFGVRDDGPPSAHPQSTANVFSTALAHGRTARSYQEAMPTTCALVAHAPYAVKHNPWAYDTRHRRACRADDVPSGTLASGRLRSDIVNGRLPNVGELTPDLDHDAHDGSLAAADNWLKGWLSLIYSGPDWRSGHLAVIVTADEDDGHSGNTVLTTVIHPSQSAHVVTAPLSHYSLTRMLTTLSHAHCIRSGCTTQYLSSAFGLTLS
jgi:acid phosphatase